MERIGMEHLRRQIEVLERQMPGEGWELSGANGGWQLTATNGSRIPFPHGHIAKRDLFNRMNAFIQGIAYAQNLVGGAE